MASLARKLNAHLKAAKAYAELSHCKRLKVGAVIVRDDRIVSVGYNGMPSGGSNVCECIKDGELVSKPYVIHAEKNAIAFAAKHGLSTTDAMLVVTHSPCQECCTLIIQAGIKEVYYEEAYRDTKPIEFLERHGVACQEILTY